MIRILLFLLMAALQLIAPTARAVGVPPPAIAFFYGYDAPLTELKAFDIVVLDPDHNPDPAASRKPYSEPYAYVAVGEAHPTRAYFKEIPAAAHLAVNKDWDSLVIDLSYPGWADFFADRIVAPLWKQGYRGFFLDTLDSYRLVEKFDETAQQDGLVSVIDTLHQRFPGIRLILNRGFEIVPRVKDKIQMVAAESLFQGWDAGSKRYVEVKPDDRAWLLDELHKIRDTHGIPVLSIDYVAPGDRALTRATAERIKELGIIPWVTDSDLATLGIGSREVLPRRIAIVYDDREAEALNYSKAHRFLEMPLNYLGYTVEYLDINKPLPANLPPGEFAGVIIWLPAAPSTAKSFTDWVLHQIGNKLPIVFLGGLATNQDSRTLKQLELASAPPLRGQQQLNIVSANPMFQGETPLRADRRQLVPLRLAGTNGTPLVELVDASNNRYIGAALTSWGGFALDPFVIEEIANTEQTRWHFDPFEFLAAALRLPPMPMPNATTENGRRLLLAHIDGDGFPSRAEVSGSPLCGEVLLNEILMRYRIPHAMSVIEAEVAPDGLYPKDSAAMENIARRMFALPHVEIASHTYTHPFQWEIPTQSSTAKEGQEEEAYHLNVPGYTFDLRREIIGSVDYIRERLAPKGKPVQLLFWSGDAAPGADALEIVAQAGYLNINGGDTQITRSFPSMTSVSAIGIGKGGYRQIYAPMINENVYTNLWTGPFYGYRRVIETFQMTETPRRLKPIGIYYHSYSASKKASINALHEVYRWALAQNPYPVFPSEYIRKALDFYDVVIAREGNDWRVRGTNHLRTLRAPASLGFPDPATSLAVAGSRPVADEGNYISLTGEDALLHFSEKPSDLPYLYEANGRLTDWQVQDGNVRLALKAHTPLEFSLAAGKRCSVSANGKPITPRRTSGNLLEFRLGDAAATIETRCRDR